MASTLSEKEQYLLGLVDAIVRMEQTPFPFLCAATMVEYLIKISGYNAESKDIYSDFIKEYFPLSYKQFNYESGKTDLPEQMYYILRNGLVHRFSLFPDSKGTSNGARNRAILITHRSSNEGPHLAKIKKTSEGHCVDAALFVLEDFCYDISSVIRKIFLEASKNTQKEFNINQNWEKSPPVKWLGYPI